MLEFIENITGVRNVDPKSDAVQFAAKRPRFVA